MMTAAFIRTDRSVWVAKTQASPRPEIPSRAYNPYPEQRAQSEVSVRRMRPGTEASWSEDAVVGDDFFDQSANQGVIRRDTALQQVV